MEHITLLTLLQCLKSDDVVFRNEVKKYLSSVYGSKMIEITYYYLNPVIIDYDKYTKEIAEANYKDLLEELQQVMEKEELSKYAAILKSAIKANEYRFTDKAIVELLQSENKMLHEKAKEMAVWKYQHYIYKMIHVLYPEYAKNPVKFKELFHSGIVGLLHAVEKYRPEKGMITTWSKYSIRHELSDQINYYKNDPTVQYNTIQQEINIAIQELNSDGYDATPQRVADLIGVRRDLVAREMMVMTRRNTQSLDDVTVSGKINDYGKSPEKIYEEIELGEILKDALYALPNDLKDIMIYKYVYQWTNEAIARELGITSATVRVKVNEAIKQMHQQKGLVGNEDKLHDTDRYYSNIKEKEEINGIKTVHVEIARIMQAENVDLIVIDEGSVFIS